ncbi:hypothetical protein AZ78_1024 [Lysobacter capsici AZ78]|uniref:Uncharacterized protein n=1 Tax=Lysobacter capsici AZ78 TaxID=1444315 RepID=A0A108U6J1_9GAMM|nr:hypothetical protein AZ78_1024 [Lysobacter capsici AZ78]
MLNPSPARGRRWSEGPDEGARPRGYVATTHALTPTRPGPSDQRLGVRGCASQWLASGIHSPRKREREPDRRILSAQKQSHRNS